MLHLQKTVCLLFVNMYVVISNLCTDFTLMVLADDIT